MFAGIFNEIDLPVGAAIFIIPELAQPTNGIVVAAWAGDEMNGSENRAETSVAMKMDIFT